MSTAPPELKDIVEELHDVKAKWKRIGLQLKVPDTELEKIESTHKGDPEESFYQMIREWFKKTEEPSWSAIVTALRTRSVSEPKLAHSLERNKCLKADHESGGLLMDVVVQKEEVPYNITGELQMLPNHTDEEVPQQVKEKIRSLTKSFNHLRILTYRHLESLKVNPDELRVIVCNPERRWEGDDHRHVCLAKSISAIFSIVSHRRYLNWQNYDLLEEIIEEYGDAKLKAQLDGYCEKIKLIENEISLKDIKNIVFTPLGTNDFLMKVPIPNQIEEPKMAVVRDVGNGLKKNGYSHVHPHHVGQNSPLAIFFIVPQQCLPLPAMKKLKINSSKIEDRVVYSFSEEEALELMNIQPLAIPDEEAHLALHQGTLCITPTMGAPSSQPHQFFDETLHRSSTTVTVHVACKDFNYLPCAVKYIQSIHPSVVTVLGNKPIDLFSLLSNYFHITECEHSGSLAELIMDESFGKFLTQVISDYVAKLHPHKSEKRPQYRESPIKNKDLKHRRITKYQNKIKRLEADIQEKEYALQQMKHEKDALTFEHQCTVASLMQQSELLLLALNYCFQKTHLDYETAKDQAESLSNKEKEANEKMKIIVEEKVQLEKKNAEEMHAMAKQFHELEIVAECRVQEKEALETKYDSVKKDLDTATMELEQKDKKIKELQQRCLSKDANYAELWGKYIALAGEP